MNRQRLAVVLGVVAVLAVLGTAAVAIARHGDDGGRVPVSVDPRGTLTVHDPATGAEFEVPGGRWQVEGRSVRIYYTDERDRPVAVVRGPAVYRASYCTEQPKGSNRAFAGFTREEFDTWVEAIGTAASETDSQVTLADGTAAQLQWARVDPADSGPCAAPQVYVAMVRSGEVRVVLVADTGEPGTLPEGQVETILTSLRL
jgi:hypothetical protein